jgi:hypothetical protein
MNSLKNIYNLEKTLNFFKKYPVILMYQHNNLTVKQIINLKVELQIFDNIKILIAKNSIVDRFFLENVFYLFLQSVFFYGVKKDKRHNVKKDKNQIGCLLKNKQNIQKEKIIGNGIQNLIQGPLLLIGCNSMEEVQKISMILKASPSFLFLGSLYNNQIYTHLDFQKSLELNNNVYYEFLSVYDQLLNFYNIINYQNMLQNSVVFHNLFSICNLLKIQLEKK